MSGAAVLCGSAALRGGAGTVQIATPDVVQPTVAAGQICCTTTGLTSNPDGQLATSALSELLKLSEHATVLAMGPGLGRSSSVRWVVRGLLEQSSLPIVLDADGIEAIAPLAGSNPIRAGDVTIMTPHPGEFARLTGMTTPEVQADREGHAVRFAKECDVVLVLKGANSLVTDGHRLYVNRTGNPGMATGGSGDVLTGLIAALVAQKLGAFAAAQLGVYLHGLAGDLARDDLGEEAMIASDLLAYLPKAFVQYRTT
jgi:ADP-dependent NAD(P)H-hydrate dehydratase